MKRKENIYVLDSRVSALGTAAPARQQLLLLGCRGTIRSACPLFYLTFCPVDLLQAYTVRLLLAKSLQLLHDTSAALRKEDGYDHAVARISSGQPSPQAKTIMPSPSLERTVNTLCSKRKKIHV